MNCVNRLSFGDYVSDFNIKFVNVIENISRFIQSSIVDKIQIYAISARVVRSHFEHKVSADKEMRI